ncbi:Hypothetical predicted protein, partial [Pelobates cultripes]
MGPGTQGMLDRSPPPLSLALADPNVRAIQANKKYRDPCKMATTMCSPTFCAITVPSSYATSRPQTQFANSRFSVGTINNTGGEGLTT